MALQDFTTYTEVDSGGKITVASDQITFANFTRNDNGHVYRSYSLDEGVDASYEFELNLTTNTDGVLVFALSDVIGDTLDILAASALWLDAATNSLRFILFESGGFIAAPEWASPLSTPYTVYITITVDADGGLAGKGQFECLIYDNVARQPGDLLDTLSIDAVDETLASYADYQYSLNGQFDLGVGTDSGYVKDLDITPDPDPAGIIRTRPNTSGNMDDLRGNMQ